MPQTAALDRALLMYIRYVCTHAYVISKCTDRFVTPSALTVLSICKSRSDEETSVGLHGQDVAVLSPSTVRQFLEGKKLPHKEGHHAALPLTCPLCERETSQTVFINKTTGGLVCPPCKVHGELMGGLCCPMHCSETDVSQGCCGRGGGVLQGVSA